MPDRWNEDRERRERNWRNEAYGRGGDEQRSDPRQGRLWQEDRSFGDERGGPTGGYGAEAGFSGRDGYESSYRSSRDRYAARFEGRDRDRVFGERDTGAEYNRSNVRSGGGAYGAGGSYGGGQSYGRGAGGGRDHRGGEGRPEWQDRDYQGVSPAYENGEYDLERRRGMRFESQDYTHGGRFYGDDQRQPIYRHEYGQGGREYGDVPRGYDADRDLERRYAREMQRPVSGGTGGYDFERGYGDGGRGDERQGVRDWQRGDDRSDRGRGTGGGFLQRAKSWLGEAVDEVRRDLSGERGQDDRGGQRYSSDYSREARWSDDRGHRGRGPKDYKRSDARISDDAHQRLTDDSWLDASNINVSVSGGEVTLSGTVENREAKHRAERCVEDIPGVRHVQNNLRIDQGSFFTSPTSGFGDSALEAQMRKDAGDANANGGTKPEDDTAATRSTTRRT